MKRSEKLDLKLKNIKGLKNLDSCIKLYNHNQLNVLNTDFISYEKLVELGSKVKELIDFDNILSEEIDSEMTFLDSEILFALYKTNELNKSYFYTQHYQECGMILKETKKILPKILQLTKSDFQETSYLIHERLDFYLTINYLNNSNSYDIQLRKKKK